MGRRISWGSSVHRHPGDSENVLTVVHKLRPHTLRAPSRRGRGLAKYSSLIVIYVSGCQAVPLEACLTQH